MFWCLLFTLSRPHIAGQRPPPDIMPSLRCPIDDCEYTTDDVTEQSAIELLKLHSIQHRNLLPQPPAPTSAPTAPVHCKKPDRPTIDLGASESQWDFFVDEWAIYKRRSGVSDDDAKLELRAACSLELRRHLFDFIGSSSLNSCNEDALLKYIKQVAVKGKNPAVHRQEFYALRQCPEEPIQQFVAKLQSKASHCAFTTKCACNKQVSYGEPMVMDQMIVGLYDKDIQGEILAKDSQLKTYQQRYDFIHALEEGKRARVILSSTHDSTPPSQVAASQSQYQRQKRSALLKKHAQPGCPGCGDTSHGRGTDRPRAQHCPYWDKVCGSCQKKGHAQSVCRAKNSTARPINQGPRGPSHNAPQAVLSHFAAEPQGASNIGAYESALF